MCSDGNKNLTDGQVRANLAEALRWAVPIYVLELRDLDDVERRRRLPHNVIANLGRGDTIMFRGKSRKSVALTFEAYGWALAYLAYQPGGVTFLGLHFCTADHDGCPHAAAPPLSAADDPDPTRLPWWAPLDELDALLEAEGRPADLPV